LVKQYNLPAKFGHEAINECCAAFKSAFANLRNKNIKFFKMGYKSSNTRTIVISKACFSKSRNSFCLRSLGLIRSSSPISSARTSKLVYGKKIYLYCPTTSTKYKITNSHKECALDPGVRTFQTLYSTNGMKEYGKGFNKIIASHHAKIKLLDSRQHTVNSKNRLRWYSKARDKIYRKLCNIVNELHWKTALELVKQFDKIYIGSFCENSKNCVKKSGPLQKVTRFATNQLKHYTFLQRLTFKATQYNKTVKVIDESYTSKTCGGCFQRNEIGSSKQYNCPNCKISIDRDLNGARNILLRANNLF
tara:strand:- start:21817 stop:22731 length:915 start_codon:yes stop_codon:yes gene_type:complete